MKKTDDKSSDISSLDPNCPELQLQEFQQDCNYLINKKQFSKILEDADKVSSVVLGNLTLH